MLQRLVTCTLLTAALAVLATVAHAQAADEKTHDGLVVSTAANRLVMSDATGGNEHTHMIAADTKVSLNGKEAKITDLKKGDKVKVTTGTGGKVISVQATRAGGDNP
jgi:anaerobic selenocysteine-containing dehydrogenase